MNAAEPGGGHAARRPAPAVGLRLPSGAVAGRPEAGLAVRQGQRPRPPRLEANPGDPGCLDDGPRRGPCARRLRLGRPGFRLGRSEACPACPGRARLPGNPDRLHVFVRVDSMPPDITQCDLRCPDESGIFGQVFAWEQQLALYGDAPRLLADWLRSRPRPLSFELHLQPFVVRRRKARGPGRQSNLTLAQLRQDGEHHPAPQAPGDVNDLMLALKSAVDECRGRVRRRRPVAGVRCRLCARCGWGRRSAPPLARRQALRAKAGPFPASLQGGVAAPAQAADVCATLNSVA